MVPSQGSLFKQQNHLQTPQRQTPLRDSCRDPQRPRKQSSSRLRAAQTRGEGQAEAKTQAARGAPPPALAALAAACGAAAVGLPAAATAAAESVAYDNSQGTELVKTLAGAAYVLLAGGFIARLWGKRSKTSLTERLASARRPSPDADFTTLASQKVTPGSTARSALQAGAVGAALFLLTTQLDQLLAAQALPEQYTARNVAGALVTVVRGLAYLITFLFCFNCLGLSALAVQLLFWPEDETAPQPAAGRGREFVVEVDKSELGPPAEKKS